MTHQEEYIEETGLFYERYGLTKMAGRILGYLLISGADQSFDTIRIALQASKGSISGNLNLLLNQHMVEKYMRTDRESFGIELIMNLFILN